MGSICCGLRERLEDEWPPRPQMDLKKEEDASEEGRRVDKAREEEDGHYNEQKEDKALEEDRHDNELPAAKVLGEDRREPPLPALPEGNPQTFEEHLAMLADLTTYFHALNGTRPRVRPTGTPELGDLVEMAQGSDHLQGYAVVTEVHEAHLTVMVLYEDRRTVRAESSRRATRSMPDARGKSLWMSVTVNFLSSSKGARRWNSWLTSASPQASLPISVLTSFARLRRDDRLNPACASACMAYTFKGLSSRYSGSQKESMAATSPDAQKVQPSDELPVTPAYKNITKKVCRETIPRSCVVMGGVLCCDEAGSIPQRSQRPQSPQKGRAKPYMNPLPTTPSDPWSSAMAAKNMPQIPKVSRSCFVCYTCAATDKVRKGDLEAQLGAAPSLSNEAYKRAPIRRT
eukprot:s165_g40.t2